MKKIVPLAVLALMMASCGEEKKDYDATGTFEATEVTVSAESSGQLISFNVTEGQLLNGGLTVGQIDSRQLALKREPLATSNQQLDANHGLLEAAGCHPTSDGKQTARFEEASGVHSPADSQPAAGASALFGTPARRCRTTEAGR